MVEQSGANTKSALNESDKVSTYERRNKINARNIVKVFHVNFGEDTFFATRFNGRLEDVSVVKVLHHFSRKIDANLLQLARLAKVKRDERQGKVG